MDMESMCILMRNLILENGVMEKCMEKEFLDGLTGGLMKGNMRMIRNKDMEF